MNPRLQNLFDENEIQRQALLQRVSKLSIDQLNHRPAPDKWSVSEVIAHLISAEQLSVAYMKKKIQGIDGLNDSDLTEELKILVLKIAQRTPWLKFKASKYVVQNTKVYKDYDSLRNEWTFVRKDLYDLLKTFNDHQLKRKVYKHSAVGYLNVQHALKFFKEHIAHHAPQIKRQLPHGV